MLRDQALAVIDLDAKQLRVHPLECVEGNAVCGIHVY